MFLPSHRSAWKPRRRCTSSSSRRTSSPFALTTSTVTESPFGRVNVMRAASFRPSPFGEMYSGIARRFTTGPERFSRWVTKNAPTVAATRTRNTTRASELLEAVARAVLDTGKR